MLPRAALVRFYRCCRQSLIVAAALIVSGIGVSPAYAAAPTFFAAGAFVSGTGSVNAAWPASHAINDLGLLIIQTNNQAVPATPAGWTAVLNSPQGIGTGGTGGSTRLTMFYRRATSAAEGVVATGDSGSVQAAMILVFRGVTTTGDPWDVTSGSTTTPASTAVSIPGGTTTVPDTMVVAIVAHARDFNTTNTQVGTWANASLSGFTDLTAADNTTNAGNGGGFAAAYGVKAVAGAYAATTAVLANSSLQAKMSIALKPPPIMTLGNGTDPAGASLAPGGAATMNDAFTFVTTEGSNQVTAVVVGLATGTAAGLSLVEVTNDGGSTVYGSVTDPGSDTPSITLSTNTLTATTASTQYKIRVTPKSHANMPAPPGATYAVTAKINSWTSTYSQSGSDTAGTTVTIDNLSPANVTVASCTAGNGQVSLGWTNPADSDFNSVIVLRNTSAVADTPVEGTGYAVSSTIGSSTVVCSTSSTGCTDTGLTNGTPYHYKIFSRDTNVNYSSAGVVPTGSPCTPAAVASFNVVDTGGDPVTGVIKTKIAGQDIAADIVARDATNAIIASFTGTVAVELVNDTGVACASLPLIKTLANQTFVGGDSGRHALSSGQFEADAHRNVKFRITYPTGSPTVTSCSTDAFANRPLQFTSILVRDANRTTAGTTNTLSNTASPGTGPVHNAGRPFQIDATAQNGAGSPATTANYTIAGGQPIALLTQCGAGAVCPATPGTLTTGFFSVSSGVITTTTASYSDVGAFNLVIEDRKFSDVDLSDGSTTAQRYISSSAVTVGRFVPDYFTIDAGSSITPRSDIVACSGSSFTYMGERMDLVFTLSAREFAGGALTPSYSGATLGALALSSAASYSFGAIDSTAPTPLTARLDLSLIPGVSATWSGGSATVTAPVAITRNATPDGPYNALKIGLAPSDPDSVTLRSADLNLDADNSGTPESRQVGATTAVRFGRLRMQNAAGSEKVDLVIPLQAQYWTGTGFLTNTADTCTSLSAGNLGFSAYTGGITAGNMNAANISLGGAFALGAGNLKLTKPTTPVPTAPGSTTLTIDLAAESKTYLQGNWGVPSYSANPSARAGFGLFGAQPRNFIFFRENY